MSLASWHYRFPSSLRAHGVFVALVSLSCFFLVAPRAQAQEPPYLVTYSDALEEPGNLEIAYKGVQASPKNANRFSSGTLELEYGAKGWWTTEVYLSGQTTQHDSTIFTGFRWENRVKPLRGQHFINPLLYVEYEDVNNADKTFLEVTGHHSTQDLQLRNALARNDVERSMELKMILSSDYKGWNISENFIAEKNLSNEPWEFGYALGTSRGFASKFNSRPCVLCRQNFAGGLELYGGLGDRYSFGWTRTSQYLGPMVSFAIPKGPTITFEPSFGLNANSVGVLYRFKVSYEVQQIFSRGRKGQ
jgi:hypothetical protein